MAEVGASQPTAPSHLPVLWLRTALLMKDKRDNCIQEPLYNCNPSVLLHNEETVASVTLPQHFVLGPGQAPETNQQWPHLPGRC